ncbi:MAG: DNA repair and recombination protein RadA, partial [Thermococcus sp.]|nr:DNA repair and recombination protein RadA [Thermococcus sp.]
IGGHILAHNVVTRLWIRRPSDMKPTRIIKLYKSPKLPSGQVTINITEKGIEDTE